MTCHSKTDRRTRGLSRNTVRAIAVTLTILGASLARNAHAATCNYQGCFYRFPNGFMAYRNAQTWERFAQTSSWYDGTCLYVGRERQGCYVPHRSGRTGYVFVAGESLFYLSFANDTSQGWTFMPYDNLDYMPYAAVEVLEDWVDSGANNSEANALLGQLALQPQTNQEFYNLFSNLFVSGVL